MSAKPRCEDIGFVHAWEDVTSYGMTLAIYPPRKPTLHRRCINCGREEIQVVVVPEVCEWQEVQA